MQFPNWIRAALQKTVSFPSPSGPSVGRMQYAPTIGYVRSFEIQMQFPNRVRAILRNTDAIPRLGTCEGSKNGSVFVPFGAVCGAYSIRPYNRVRMALQKTVLFSSPTGPRGGRIRYAPTIGYVRFFEILMKFPNWIRAALLKTVSFSSLSGLRGGAYSIRPYNRIRVILRNTDAISQPSTYGPSKNCPVFVPFGAAGWGVFNTPLRPATCDPMKYRCDLSTGWAGVFGRWGGGGYRLRGRWV